MINFNPCNSMKRYHGLDLPFVAKEEKGSLCPR